jgi:hypothetical protein
MKDGGLSSDYINNLRKHLLRLKKKSYHTDLELLCFKLFATYVISRKDRNNGRQNVCWVRKGPDWL